MQTCPCYSGKYYTECCGLFIEGQQKPLTPEALMRSRYTAYTQANAGYLLQTMKSPAKDRFDAQISTKWANQVQWIRLDIKMASTQDNYSIVEFIAYYKEEGKLNAIHEKSKFQYEDGTWYYVDGEHLALNRDAYQLNLGRNQLCYCGSGKKYKKCCLLRR